MNAAKAGLKDLEQSGGGGRGRGGRPPATSGGGPNLPGMPQLKDMAGQMGLGGPMAQASKFLAPTTGAAAAATALFVAFQKSAIEAREIRIESQKLGVTVGYFRDLRSNALAAGVSIEQVSAGIGKVNDKMGAAMTGDIASQAYFAGLGIAPGQLAGMQGSPEQLARLVAQRGSTAQQVQMFGSTDAAKAVAKSSNDSGHSRAANDALENTNLGFLDHPIDKLKEVSHSIFSGMAYYTQRAGRAYGGGMSFQEAGGLMNREASDKESQEAIERRRLALTEAGTKFGVGLLNPRETLAQEAKTEATYNYSELTALTGVSADTFHARAQTQRMQKQQAFDAQYQNPYERQEAQWGIIDRQREQGTLTGTQAYRAQAALGEQTNAAVAGTRSNTWQVGASMDRFRNQWNDPAVQAAKQKEIEAANAKLKTAEGELTSARSRVASLPASDAGKPWEPITGKTQAWHDKTVAGIDVQGKEWSVKEAQAGVESAKEKTSVEQRDAAREMGAKLTQYVEGLTAAGPQAGAYGVNTVQGASMLMGAEYQMDQSQETRKMVECLLQIAENTKPGSKGHMDRDQAAAVRDNLGFRYSDPISNLFGGP